MWNAGWDMSMCAASTAICSGGFREGSSRESLSSVDAFEWAVAAESRRDSAESPRVVLSSGGLAAVASTSDGFVPGTARGVPPRVFRRDPCGGPPGAGLPSRLPPVPSRLLPKR